MVKIVAQVKRTQLKEKLQAANIHIKDIDGESLFGEAITKMEQKQSATEIIRKAFIGFPETLLGVKMIGKPSYDSDRKKLTIKIEVLIDQNKYSAFTRDLIEKLKVIADSSNRRVEELNKYVNVKGFDGDIFKSRYSNINIINVCIQINEARTSSVWESFTVSSEVCQAVKNSVKRPKMVIDIIGPNKEIVGSNIHNAPVPYLLKQDGSSYPNIMFPVLLNAGYNPNYGVGVFPGTKNATFDIIFDVTPNELKKMRSVECRIERGS